MESTTSPGPGANSQGPWQMPARAWWSVLKRVYHRWDDQQLPTKIAGLTYRALMTFFPLMVATVAVFGLAVDPQQLTALLQPLLEPVPDQASSMIMGNAQRVVEQSTASLGTSLVIAGLVALWSLSNGILALMSTYSGIYRQPDERPFYTQRGVATLLGLGVLVAALLTALIIIALPLVLNLFHLIWLRWPIDIARYLLIATMFLAMQAFLCRYATDRRSPRWRWLQVGSIVGLVLWALISVGFEWYLTSMGRYDQVYGALSGFVVLAIWVQLSATSMVVGALINAELEYQTEVDTTVGPDRERGVRGAVVADQSVHEPHERKISERRARASTVRMPAQA